MSLPRIEVNSIRSAGPPAHSKPAALRHPACACRLRRLTGQRAAPPPAWLRTSHSHVCGDARGRPSPRSPDVRLRPPGCGSLEAGCAPASMPALAAYAVSRGDGQPLHRIEARCAGRTGGGRGCSVVVEARGAGERFPSGGRRGRTRRLLPAPLAVDSPTRAAHRFEPARAAQERSLAAEKVLQDFFQARKPPVFKGAALPRSHPCDRAGCLSTACYSSAFISRTACEKPTRTARDTIEWPMFSSPMPSSRATGTTLR